MDGLVSVRWTRVVVHASGFEMTSIYFPVVTWLAFGLFVACVAVAQRFRAR